jgi:5-methylcytosine-specific restriction protein A
MPTYLLAWNPNRWVWEGYEELVDKVQAGLEVTEPWSCGRNRSIRASDRVFLIRLGLEPRGINASGDVLSDVYEDLHWDSTLAESGKTPLFVDVRIEAILNPETERIITRDELHSPPMSGMHWDTQISGIRIPDEIAQELERTWAILLYSRDFHFPEEEPPTDLFYEGAVRKVNVNAFERNPKARQQCINHYGAICSVCNFDFLTKYGEIAANYIHIHHLRPVSEIRGHTRSIQ